MQKKNNKQGQQEVSNLAPAVVREQEIDVIVAQSKRIRISSQYMNKQEIDKIEDNEGVYQGDVIENVQFEETKQPNPNKNVQKIKQGKGIQLFLSGNIYNGDWNNNKMEGYGSYFNQSENNFYKGQFNEGDLTGRGIFFYCDSQDYYMGEVKEGKFHGKGLYFRKQSNMYELNEYKEGKVVKSIKTGEGKPQSLEITKELVQDEKFEDIYIKPKDFFFEHYEGDLISGKKQGNGILFNKDGSRFEGTWKDNKPNGLGVYVYPDQKFDMGEYKNGHLHGFGRSQFHNQDTYRGYFYKGRMQGLGLYLKYQNQEWIFGYFKNNSLSQEFEKGQYLPHQSSLPNFGFLENKYKDLVDQENYNMDIQFIENQIQTSEQRRRKSGGNSNTKDNTMHQESKKKILNLTVEEQVQRKYLEDKGSSYCSIF